MSETDACLGLCFFGNQLFYAAGKAEQYPRLSRIGAVDFNFDIARALLENNPDEIEGLHRSISQIANRFNTPNLRMLLPPATECWATLPKLVYDDAREREAYINILMHGMERKNIHPSWHGLSKDNRKLLQLRTARNLKGSQALTAGFSHTDFLSTFEIGEIWIEHARPGGSFLTISTFKNGISVSSFILGKLRGATYIEFDDINDLPYLWLQKAQNISWMQGLHEQIQVYGYKAHRIIEILQPFWDEAGTINKMNTLQKMQVEAEEETYGFDLSLAYPAVMLAIRNT